MSALINAMYETNKVAIVRRVYAARSAPRIGVLFPQIKTDYEVNLISCFLFISVTMNPACAS